MKHILVLSIILCAISLSAQAQADKAAIKGAAATATTGVGRDAKKLPDTLKWKKGGDISLNFSQTTLTNWTAGGENSLSLSSSANLFANYKKNKIIWENYAFFAYGIIKAGDRKSVKNSDQINIGSRIGYQMAKSWYYTAAMLGKTQFAPGYKYTSTDTIRISNFLAPAYLYLSLGLDYKPSGKVSISFAPAMGKATFVRFDDPVILSSSGITQDLIDQGKKARYEFGGGIVFNLNGNFFSKKVTYISQLELFSNYLEKPQNVDVVWDFQFRIAITKFVAANVRLNMIYDDNQKTFRKEPQPDGSSKDMPHGAKLQVKEYFEIGLFYVF
ncbi:MAG: DUF3078 domain-containing protein [Bacteroidales bacterium]|jgi:hypothetical protein|nr:DUF3078 domain-containing protein [Bacteroidales bacterium]